MIKKYLMLILLCLPFAFAVIDFTPSEGGTSSGSVSCSDCDDRFIQEESDPLAYNGTLAYNSSLSKYLRRDGTTTLTDTWTFGEEKIRGESLYSVSGFTLSGADVSSFNQEYEYDAVNGWYEGETTSFYAVVDGADLGSYGESSSYWYAVDNWESPFYCPYYKISKSDLLNGVSNGWTTSDCGSTAPTGTYELSDDSPVQINGSSGDAYFDGTVAMNLLATQSWVAGPQANVYINPEQEDISLGSNSLLWSNDDGANYVFIAGKVPTDYNSSNTMSNSVILNSAEIGTSGSDAIGINRGKATGSASFAFGDSWASTSWTAAGGRDAKNSHITTFAHSSGDWYRDGSSQTEEYILNAYTSSNTPREMAVGYRSNSNPSGVGGGNRLIVPTNSTILYEVNIMAIERYNSSNIGHFSRRYLLHNDDGSTSIVKSETIGTDYNPGSWLGGITTSTVDISGIDIFQIKVAGPGLNRFVQWTGSVKETILLGGEI